MSELVKVEDLEVFRLFRAALFKFAQAADQALSNADGEISGTHSWLENEQATYWQGQLRKRSEAIAAAREAVRKKKLYKDASGHTPNAAEEEKALRRCLAAVDQAQNKIEAVRKSLRRLEKETELYRGGVARLAVTVTSSIPQGVALLDRLAATLEQYMQIEAPSGAAPDSAAAAPLEESFSRGNTPPEQPPAKAEPPAVPPGAATVPPPPSADDPAASSAVGSAESSPRKEKPHVADGK